MKNTPLRLALLLILLLIWGSCESYRNPGADNPLDPDNPGFTKPEVAVISGPALDEIVNSHTVTFGLKLNETATEFKYMFDYGDWSAWQSDTTVTLTYLDEGSHNIIFKARNAVGIEQDDNVATDFVVDAIKGPALRFYPRKVCVQQNQQFMVQIYAEEVVDMAGLTIDISRNEAIELVFYQILDDVYNQNFFNESAQILSVPETNLVDALIKISMMRVGQPAAASGTGALVFLTLKFTGTQTTQLTFSPECVMLDSAMQTITINELVPLEVVRK